MQTISEKMLPIILYFFSKLLTACYSAESEALEGCILCDEKQSRYVFHILHFLD